MTGESAVTSIKDRSTYSSIFFRFGVVPSTRNFRKLVQPSVRIAMEWVMLKIISGLYPFIFRDPLAPANPTATSLGMTSPAIMVRASHWVGLTLPALVD